MEQFDSKSEIDYKKLCHNLEGRVDEAIKLLRTVPHTSAQCAAELLCTALQETEEEIIKERENIFPFPTAMTSDQFVSLENGKTEQAK